MFRRDYILRLLDQFAEFMSIFLAKLKTGKTGEAEFYLQSASRTLLGLDFRSLLLLADEDLLEFFGANQYLGICKCYILSQFLLQDARLCELRQDQVKAQTRYGKALALLLTCHPHLEEDLRSEAGRSIEEILERLGDLELPAGLRKGLILFHERSGRYAQAENCLFELVEAGEEGFLALGESFYARLMDKTEQELQAGGLSHAEAAEGLAELRQRAGAHH